MGNIWENDGKIRETYGKMMEKYGKHMGVSENVVYPYTQWFC